MKVTALAGGVGGAKLADGLARVSGVDDLTVIVNTGDDFSHLGLYICPDLDTVCYTLAGLANPETGWGRREESWTILEQLKILGGPTWFRLGDRDLATHLERTRRLHAGQLLHSVTQSFCLAWGVKARVIPMSDEPVSTWVETVEKGWLPFQEYFVREGCAPQVTSFRFKGLAQAQPAPGVIEALQQADVVVICPSNPWVSIAPILSIKGIKDVLLARKDCVAVSPLIGGNTVKGPAAKMYTEMGLEPTNLSVANHYREIIKVLVIDEVDRDDCLGLEEAGVTPVVTHTLMKSIEDREFLASEVLKISGLDIGKKPK